ncbi:MAG: nicotinate-nucleotide adenylyltransferase [Lachnospiraceae bacterium]|nr:nicotinate-nucleotide adenylyltransferase [Lachnospiraceae bacterium]
MRTRRIGIIGGTFNPIHIGHLILAENAYDSLGLEKVIFMPTGRSYLKDASVILPSSDRMMLIDEAIAGNDHFESSDHEIKKSGNTYTAETLSELNDMYPENEFHFIIGEDSIYNIESWYKPQMIFDNCVLVVAPRGHEPDDKLIDIKDHLCRTYNARIVLLDTPDIDISSSMIRDRVSRGAGIRYYVPAGVERLICEHGFYTHGSAVYYDE